MIECVYAAVHSQWQLPRHGQGPHTGAELEQADHSSASTAGTYQD